MKRLKGEVLTGKHSNIGVYELAKASGLINNHRRSHNFSKRQSTRLFSIGWSKVTMDFSIYRMVHWIISFRALFHLIFLSKLLKSIGTWIERCVHCTTAFQVSLDRLSFFTKQRVSSPQNRTKSLNAGWWLARFDNKTQNALNWDTWLNVITHNTLLQNFT